GENANARAVSGVGRREHEHRLGVVELARDRLHRRRVEGLRVEHDGERIAGKAPVGEHVERGESPAHESLPCARYYSSGEETPRSPLPGLPRQSIVFANSSYEEDGPAGQARGGRDYCVARDYPSPGPRHSAPKTRVNALKARATLSPLSRGEGHARCPSCSQSPLIKPASISNRLKRRASAPPAQA